MYYKDGFKLSSSGHALIFPKCKNEKLDKTTDSCGVCGTMLYNKCEGYWDEYDQVEIRHNNPGNAGYCETCGKPTHFYA